MNQTSLASLLAHRTLRPGEAVTVLVALLQTLADLHRLECTHGRITAESVVFDAVGRPTLDGWEGCVEHRDHAGLSPGFRPAMVEDCRQFVDLARRVLGRVEPALVDAPTFLQAEFARFERGRREPFVRAAEALLFAVGAAEAVDLDEGVLAGGSLDGGVPAQGVLSAGGAYDWGAEASDALASISADVDALERRDFEAMRPGARLRASAQMVRAASVAARGSVLGWWSGRGSKQRAPRRRAVVVGMVVAVGAVTGALLTVPQAEPGAAAVSSGVPAQTDRPTGTAGPSGATGPSGSAGPSDAARSSQPAEVADPAIRGDDPLAAGEALLAARSECLRLLSLHCLEGVDQYDSAAMADDRRTIGARGSTTAAPGVPAAAAPGAPATAAPDAPATAGPGVSTAAAPAAALFGSGGLKLVQTAGATAILAVLGSSPGEREPASLLLVKGEAGWRIREIFAPD